MDVPTFDSLSLLCDFAPLRELLFDAVQDRDRFLSLGGRPGRSQANGVLSPEIIPLPTVNPDGPFFCGGNSPEAIVRGAARWRPKSRLRARGCTECFVWSIWDHVKKDLQTARFDSHATEMRLGEVASSLNVMVSEREHSSLDFR